IAGRTPPLAIAGSMLVGAFIFSVGSLIFIIALPLTYRLVPEAPHILESVFVGALAFGFFVGGASGGLIWGKYGGERIREGFRTTCGNKHRGSVPTKEIARLKGAHAILREESTEAGPPTETVRPNGHSENERQGDMNEYEKKWKRVEEEGEDDDFFGEMVNDG